MAVKKPTKKTKLNNANNTVKELKKIIPMNKEQEIFTSLMREKRLIICDAVYGSGKTFLALIEALKMIHDGNTTFDKLLYIRPHVPSIGSDEDLGALPGDLSEKIGAFFFPIMDNLEGIVSMERLAQYIEDDVIQVTTPSFLRGRSLNNTIVVFDECQNADKTLFKLVISRIADTSKLICIGSSLQIDLRRPERSFLKKALNRLSKVDECGCCIMTECVRSDSSQAMMLALDTPCDNEYECETESIVKPNLFKQFWGK